MSAIASQYVETDPRSDQLQVTLQLEQQAKLVAQLHDAMGELSGRLTPVLAPSVPTDGKIINEARRECGPLANQLMDANEGLRALLERLRDVTGRLER